MARTGKVFIDSKGCRIQVIINSKNPSLVSLLILSTLSLFCFSFPIYILFLNKVAIGFGFVITILIFGGSGIYFLRKLLWNTLGKEVYQISNNKVTYHYNYWVFNDNKQVTAFDKLKLGYATLNEPYIISEFSANKPLIASNLYLAAFIIEKTPIVSNIPLNINNILKFKNMEKNI
ncbi:hypothetical protein [Aequorivita marina]|uniref:hypothetical protein n=1 Tax=Aequorivita marina TaxID=3073654 RepID=UPI002873F6BC|nr:hypothetical protein [Aequorivita sp. S2608]MDS1297405.1 hypothetical protein [Aequorivita sp. S2608]